MSVLSFREDVQRRLLDKQIYRQRGVSPECAIPAGSLVLGSPDVRWSSGSLPESFWQRWVCEPVWDTLWDLTLFCFLFQQRSVRIKFEYEGEKRYVPSPVPRVFRDELSFPPSLVLLTSARSRIHSPKTSYKSFLLSSRLPQVPPGVCPEAKRFRAGSR